MTWRSVIETLVACLLATCLLGSGPFATEAMAQESDEVRDEARRLATEGITALREGRAEEALALLRQAEQLFHAPTNVLYIARAFVASGRPIEGYRAYVQVIVEKVPNYASPAFHKAQRVARAEVRELESKVALVRVDVEGASNDIVVRVDGERVDPTLLAMPLALEPGRHRVSVSEPGKEIEHVVDAVVGKTVNAEAQADAPPSAPPPVAATSPSGGPFNRYPVATGVALGIGGTGIIAGAITGGLSWRRVSGIKQTCIDDNCPPAQRAAGNEARRLGNASTVLFAIGGAGMAAGIGLMIADVAQGGEKPSEQSARLVLHVGVAGVVIAGSL